MLNKVMIIGNVTRDIEVTYLASGDQISKFSVATNRKWKDKSGEKKEETEFHNITVFGALAKVCSDYLAKGSKVYIEGRIKTDNWEKDGQKHYRTGIIAENMTMLGGKLTEREESKPQHVKSAPSSQPDEFEDDIPF